MDASGPPQRANWKSPRPAQPQHQHFASASSSRTGTADGEEGPLGQGEKSLDREQGEVQSMSALGKTPFHLRDLLREDLIFIVFVLKALESKI